MIIEGLQIPVGVQPVNPVPSNTWSGPYTGLTEALQTIPIGVRFPTMEVRILNPTGTAPYNYSMNIYTASTGATEYILPLNRQANVLNALPTGVTTTITLPTAITGQTNESVLHFNTGAGLPTIAYNGFTPVWLNGNTLSLKINKSYTIAFEQVRIDSSTWKVKTSWGEY